MRMIDGDALIKALIRKEPFSDCARVVIAECIEEVRHTPTIEPERKIGTWEPVEEIPSIRKRFKRYCCSNCKKEGFDTWNYCPECGQKNREGEQE